MKKNAWLILLAPLLVTACQDNNNTAAQKTAQPAVAEQRSQSTAPTPAPEHPSAPAAADSTANMDATDTVAVTKPEKSTVAARVQQSMAESKAAAAVSASDLVADTKTAVTETAKTTASKGAATATEPVAAVKSAASEVAATAPVAAAAQAATGDAAKGKSIANKCKACHNFTAKKKMGPGLKGVFGRKAGAMPDMKYGAALAAGGWVWDEKNLAAWLCDSRKAVKSLSGDPAAKTKMPPQRICDATKQADLIAYLKTL